MNERPNVSPKSLLKSTTLAFVVAMVVLVTCILPAEYGVDPTGFGRLTGLQQMGETKKDIAYAKTVHDQTQLYYDITGQLHGMLLKNIREDNKELLDRALKEMRQEFSQQQTEN